MLPADYITSKIIGAFFTGADFWFSLSATARAVIATAGLLLAAIYFVVNYYTAKISALKKEKLANTAVSEKQERKIEDAGREKNRLLAVISELDYAIMAFDENGKVFLANKAAEKMLGIRSRPLKGMHFSELAILKDIKPLAPYFLPRYEAQNKEIKIGKNIVKFSAFRIALEDKNSGKVIILRDAEHFRA